MDFDAIIVGAGFAGAVIAERLAKNKLANVLLVEKRPHVGGNCYDYIDPSGILVHKYGPHSFHSPDPEVVDYLSQFTEWLPFQLRVRAFVDGTTIPLPFNLNSLELCFPLDYAQDLAQKLIFHFGFGKKIPIFKLRQLAEDIQDSQLEFLADFIFKKVFLGYTNKQWEEKPEDLVGVLERVPISITRNDTYHNSNFRAMPARGYSQLFNNILSNPRIKLLLKTDFRDVISVDLKEGSFSLFGKLWRGKFYYTGPIDLFFHYKHGKLPYRSLNFEYKRYNIKNYQDCPVINYPNDYNFTRITEFKHFYPNTGLANKDETIIALEFPTKSDEENDPYYPIPKSENLEKLGKYHDCLNTFKEIANKYGSEVHFLGRLAEYKYYDMWAVIRRALDEMKELN